MLDAASRSNRTDAISIAGAHALSAAAVFNTAALDDATDGASRTALRTLCLNRLVGAMTTQGPDPASTAATLLAATVPAVAVETAALWPRLTEREILRIAREWLARTLGTAAEAMAELLARPDEASSAALASGIIVLDTTLEVRLFTTGGLRCWPRLPWSRRP